MSHRTQPLQQLTGWRHVVREVRYHEGSRQGLGVLLAVVFAGASQPLPWILYLATPLIVTGILVRLWASGHVKKNQVLATDGPYALVRHPHYAGNILILFGFAAASALWWSPILVAGFLCFYYPPAIEYEDRKLQNLFGATWQRWAKETPALLPTKPRSSASKSKWSLRKSLHGNAEPAVAAFLLVWLVVIYWRLG